AHGDEPIADRRPRRGGGCRAGRHRGHDRLSKAGRDAAHRTPRQLRPGAVRRTTAPHRSNQRAGARRAELRRALRARYRMGRGLRRRGASRPARPTCRGRGVRRGLQRGRGAQHRTGALRAVEVVARGHRSGRRRQARPDRGDGRRLRTCPGGRRQRSRM
ncbi:MAG: hypothetical protein AVDCRST_MAG64-2825, partial [uncultured Phycisphaerae bacterium]